MESCELIPNIAFKLCKKYNLLKEPFFKKNIKNKFYVLVRLNLNEGKNFFITRLENVIHEIEGKYTEFLIAQNEKQSESFWRFRENLTEAQKLEGKVIAYDISLPIDVLENFISFSKKEISKILPGIKFYPFGHLGDSNIHFNLIEPDDFQSDFDKYEVRFSKIIYKYVLNNKGSISAEHGIGYLKKNDFIDSIDKEELNVIKGIKKIFDPRNILNYGKII